MIMGGNLFGESSKASESLTRNIASGTQETSLGVHEVSKGLHDPVGVLDMHGERITGAITDKVKKEGKEKGQEFIEENRTKLKGALNKELSSIEQKHGSKISTAEKYLPENSKFIRKKLTGLTGYKQEG